jgi:hypothetical protein
MELVKDEKEISRLYESMTEDEDAPEGYWYGKLMDGGKWYILRSMGCHLQIWLMDDHDEAMTLFRQFDRELQRLIDAKNSI